MSAQYELPMQYFSKAAPIIEVQNAVIKRHLLQGMKITQIQAFQSYGVLRLSARIYDLKKRGLQIRTVMISDGRKRYAQYSLIVKN